MVKIVHPASNDLRLWNLDDDNTLGTRLALAGDDGQSCLLEVAENATQARTVVEGGDWTEPGTSGKKRG